MHDISIVIVNYNGKRYIDKLFESLERLVHDGFSYEVVFVDNNSSDDSVEYLRSRSYKLDLNIVCSDENRGFAGGNNYGVAGQMEDMLYSLIMIHRQTADGCRSCIALLKTTIVVWLIPNYCFSMTSLSWNLKRRIRLL